MSDSLRLFFLVLSSHFLPILPNESEAASWPDLWMNFFGEITRMLRHF